MLSEKSRTHLISALAGSVVPVEAEVKRTELVKVPAGELECYRVELSIPQVFWYSTDSRRALVKFEAEGIVAELEEIYVQEPGRPSLYRHEEFGLSLSLPPDWLYYTLPYGGREVVFLLDPNAAAQTRMEIRHKHLDGDECSSQIAANSKLRVAKSALHDYTVRDGSWNERDHAGWPAISFVGDFRELAASKVHYYTFIENGHFCVDFTLKTTADRFEALRGVFDSIIESYAGPSAAASEAELDVPEVQAAKAEKGEGLEGGVVRRHTRVNEFSALQSSAKSGDTTLDVEDAKLNENGRFDGGLGPGDLIFVIQMQGATIDGEATDSSWGRILDDNNSGNWEFASVIGISGKHTIHLEEPLRHDYDAEGKVQVVRVPRYSSLVVRPDASLTTKKWNGKTGGVLVLSIDDDLVIEKGAVIDVSGRGFRGGRLHRGSSNLQFTHRLSSTLPSDGAEKGESIAGYREDYSRFGGMYCYGAPANGGGGGNSHNAAGGGGANAGDISAWTGRGNPDLSNPEWEKIWDLEFEGFAESRSSGGGRGGYTWSNHDADAFVDPPGTRAWAGDGRRVVGGLGGRPLDYSTGKLFLGGGGGSGEANGFNGTAGGNGGGLIFIRCRGEIQGEGKILANGGSVRPTTTVGKTSADGSGGGGAGGTIVIEAKKTSGITVIANGGHGGNQKVENTANLNFFHEAEGGGGGGGGGFISVSGEIDNVRTEARGGKNGTTDSPALTEFPPNGATSGGNGIILRTTKEGKQVPEITGE